MMFEIVQRFLSLGMVLWSAWAYGQNPEIQKLSLKDAVHKALESSSDFLTLQNQLEIARLETKNAWAAFLPSLDLSASHGLKRLDPDSSGETTRSPVVSGTTLSMTENLYDNGESAKKYRIAELREKLADLNFHKGRAQLIRDVVLAYYRLNISVQNLKFTTKNYEELERLAKLVSNQYFQGLKTKKDFLSFRTRSQRGRLDVIEAEKRLKKYRGELLAVIGLSAESRVQFDENLKPVLPSRNLTQDIQVKDLYETRALELQRQMGDVEIDLARRRAWPEVSLVGAASYGSSNYVDRNQDWGSQDLAQWSVLLNLKINIIDWGVRTRNIQIAARTQSNAEQSLRAVLVSSEKDLEAFKLDLERAAEKYRLSKELQKMEEDTFSLLERDYRAGQTTYLELTTGLANLLDAQARGLEADFEQADLYLKWKYYKGNLSEQTMAE